MCGILGFFSPTEKISLTDFSSMLYKLKHRGQDSCGISFLIKGRIDNINKKNFSNLDDVIERMYNNHQFSNIVGHVQYITSSKESPITQPRKSKNAFGSYSFVFNGNIPTHLYEKYNHYTADTLLIEDFINNNSYKHSQWETLLEEFMNTFRRSYSLFIQTKNGNYIMRDRSGVRPLYYLKQPNQTYIFTSETCVFTNGKYDKNNIVEVKPGEIISLKNGLLVKINIKPPSSIKEAHCLFEYIYFLKSESIFADVKVKDYRRIVGEKMGLMDRDFYKNNTVKIPIVMGVPNTGNDYARSYADGAELEYCEYITKNKNVDRTFILKNEEERNRQAKQKYVFDERMKGENIVLVDDSLVRGVTMNSLVKRLLEFGVNEIHIRITSPPVIAPCNYGIDIPTREELIYNTYSGEKALADYFGCSSLKYFNLEYHRDVVPDFNKKCVECFSPSGKYEW